MKILNVVFILIIKFINIQFFTLIANFVESVSVYDQIPLFNVPIPSSYVVFDLLDDDLDKYYPLGLTVEKNGNDKEFSVDNLATFGKEVKIVFGNRCVSLTSYARNIKIKLNYNFPYYRINLEYDLLGSKISKLFEQDRIAFSGELIKFNTYPGIVVPSSTDEEDEILEDDGKDEDEMGETQLADDEQPVSQPHKPKDASDVSKEELEHYGSTPTKESEEAEESDLAQTLGAELDSAPTLPAQQNFRVNNKGEIEITQPNLHGASGFQDSDTVVAGSLDFRCLYFKNTDNVYNKLLIKGSKLRIPQTAEYFEVCYREHKGDLYILVSSMFSTVVVEQTYKCGTFGLSPMKDFSNFEGLKTLFDRRVKPARPAVTPTPSPLNLDNYEPDENSLLEKIVFDKCTVFRYVDGLETDDRVGSVTSVKFGEYEYTLKPENKFVMASVCNPYLSTRYVSIMLKEAFVYENKIFYSPNGKTYHERRHLDDEERLNIINMTSKVWHKRNHNGKIGNLDSGSDDSVEVLCLNQLTGTKTSTSKSCKDIDKLQNFRVQFNSKEMSHLYYKKNKPKSSVLIGNIMFDLNTVTDGHKYLYVSHPEDEPISLLVVEKYNESYAIIETAKGSNLFMPVNDALEDSPSRFSRKDVNLAIYRGSVYGMTWDYNEHLKIHYLFPSNFPDYCLGDLTFHNMKIMSYRGEGYKQISTKEKSNLTNIKVTSVMSKKKVILEIESDGKNTKVEWANPPQPETEQPQQENQPELETQNEGQTENGNERNEAGSQSETGDQDQSQSQPESKN